MILYLQEIISNSLGGLLLLLIYVVYYILCRIGLGSYKVLLILSCIMIVSAVVHILEY